MVYSPNMAKGHNHEPIESLLKKAGSKNTGPRFLVLEVLAHATKPLSTKEIHKKVEKQGIDPVTVYRIIKAFVEKGIVRQIDFGHDQAYFEIVDEKNDHHHIICTKCHKVVDFTGCDADKLIAAALKQTKEFSRIDRHSFELYGICKSCQKHA